MRACACVCVRVCVCTRVCVLCFLCIIFSRAVCSHFELVGGGTDAAAVRILAANNSDGLVVMDATDVNIRCSVSLCLCVSVSLCLCLRVSVSLCLCVSVSLSLCLSESLFVFRSGVTLDAYENAKNRLACISPVRHTRPLPVISPLISTYKTETPL